MRKKSLFIAATGQNIGKTTVCLGIVAGLRKRYGKVGYMKPVGQEHVETKEGISVDKDVLLFKNHFRLESGEEEMSPVLLPKGFTRDYLDGKIVHRDLEQKIFHSFHIISQTHDVSVIEGTGHTGVGSIIDLNNAQVAALVKSPILLVASGGLGSSFDELSLNRAQCEKYEVPIAGVILNRVFDDKREMIAEYMEKALQKWKIPLLGCIPYDSFLSTPTMRDFEELFDVRLLSGASFGLRHFQAIRLVAAPLETYEMQVIQNELMITPASREEIILATLAKYWDARVLDPSSDLGVGMILTGSKAPSHALMKQIRSADIPMIYVPLSSAAVMKMINTSTAKICKDDRLKIEEAIRLVEQYIDFDQIDRSLHMYTKRNK